ncbi:MAG: hypothetical protein R3B95_11290 [Nitrospirales bacterium]
MRDIGRVEGKNPSLGDLPNLRQRGRQIRHAIISANLPPPLERP